VNEEKAIKLFITAIEKNPAMIEAYFKLADIYRRKNDLDSAISNIKKITEISAYNEKAYLYSGHIYLAKALAGVPVKTRNIKQRKFLLGKSKANFEEALRLNPKNIELNSYIADIYSYLGEDDKSMETREKAGSAGR
jgi:tetratricopeptide (TPR) repeat protein